MHLHVAEQPLTRRVAAFRHAVRIRSDEVLRQTVAPTVKWFTSGAVIVFVALSVWGAGQWFLSGQVQVAEELVFVASVWAAVVASMVVTVAVFHGISYRMAVRRARRHPGMVCETRSAVGQRAFVFERFECVTGTCRETLDGPHSYSPAFQVVDFLDRQQKSPVPHSRMESQVIPDGENCNIDTSPAFSLAVGDERLYTTERSALAAVAGQHPHLFERAAWTWLQMSMPVPLDTHRSRWATKSSTALLADMPLPLREVGWEVSEAQIKRETVMILLGNLNMRQFVLFHNRDRVISSQVSHSILESWDYSITADPEEAVETVMAMDENTCPYEDVDEARRTLLAKLRMFCPEGAVDQALFRIRMES